MDTMMRVLLVLLVFCAGTALAADQWLCIGDATATLAAPRSEENVAPFKAEAFKDSQKFIVSVAGLKRVGEDDYWMQPCVSPKQGFGQCVNERRELGWFNKNANNTFLMHEIAVRDGEFHYIFTAGRCSKL